MAKKGTDHVYRCPIAICGIGLRLPGSIRSGDDFWDVLINGKDTQGPIPPSRFNIDGFDDSLGGQGAIKTRRGYFIDEDLAASPDTSFFSMSKNELRRCDPQQRLLLEVVRECLEDACEVDYRGKAVGCYVGTFGQDWYEMMAKDSQHTGSHTVTGYSDMMLANRVSYEYDLRGPSMVLKTACSSSLVALHEACRALQANDAVAAVVGGTSIILGPSTTSLFFNEGVLSEDASCKTFDAAADGFARAEGIACVYIKRLDDALRDGSPVRAVIRGTGSNSDGRSQGLMNPNTAAHEALMRSVYNEAGLEPDETLVVECHGTGTSVGDPIEAAAVGNVFAEKGVFITSVKPNIGHSEGCSGIASLIKAILILEHGIIPPQINFEIPNPEIAFDQNKLKVPTTPMSFLANKAERISINSFGIGGSNAHAIVESESQYMRGSNGSSTRSCIINHDRELVACNSGTEGDDPPQIFKEISAENIFLLSANTTSSLQRQIEVYKDYLQKRENAEHNRARNIAYTLAVRRELLPFRTFLVMNEDGELIGGSINPTKKSASPPRAIMVFSGQGAQWPMMGKKLITASSSFRRDLARMDEILQGLKIPPNWSIVDEIQKPPESSRLHFAELAQPLSSAFQIALYRLLRSFGITPVAVMGHSSGEIAAAYAAGRISLEYAMVLAYYRGYVAGKAKAEQLKDGRRASGGMAVVGLPSDQVSRFMRPGVCVACENSPSNVTISGDIDIVQDVLQSIRNKVPDVLTRVLKVDTAYHSHHMRHLAGQYQNLVEEEVDMRSHANGSVEDGFDNPIFVSSVTCKAVDVKESLSPQYWVSNLVSPVRFNDAVSTLMSLCTQTPTAQRESNNVLLEVGPHSTLAGPLREICSATRNTYNYIPCQVRGGNGFVDLLSSLGRLYQEGLEVSWHAMYPTNSKAVTGLPVYPWDHSGPPYWYESRLSAAWRHRKYPHHCLLGIRVVESPDNERLWRNVVHLDHVPWIRDHKFKGDIVFPLAGYIGMVGEAVRQMTSVDAYRLRLVTVSAALVMTDAKPTEMVTSLRRRKLTDWGQEEESTWLDFTVSSFNGSVWIKHCEGQASSLVTPTCQVQSPALRDKPRDFVRILPGSRLYESFSRIGMEYGPEFKLLDKVSSSATERVAKARLTISQPRMLHARPFLLHPAVMDACIQLLLVANARGLCRNLGRAVMPTKIAQVEVASGPGSSEIYAHADGSLTDGASNFVECGTESDNLSFRMSGLHVTPLDEDEEGADDDVHAAARLHWLPDFDFADVTKLFTPPSRTSQDQRRLEERLALLCILETADKVDHLTPSLPHMKKYREWLRLQVLEGQNSQNLLVDDASEITALPRPQRIELLHSTLAEIVQLPGKHAVARAMKRITDHAEGIFTGERDTLDMLLKDDVLSEMYDDISFGYGDFVRLLSHARPNLRILEVGAGTGGTTDRTLRALLGDQWDLPPYSAYTFTDVSAGFFPQASKRFAYADNMDFATLDITQNPLKQGFSAASYGLIIASNVVHATPSLRSTLKNLELLLSPDGILLMTEISTITRAPGFIFGNFSGWWLGEGDDREWEPYVSPARWDKELKAAGMTGTEAIVADDEMPSQLCVTIMSRPNRPVTAKASTPRSMDTGGITLLCDSQHSSVTKMLLSALRDSYTADQMITMCTIEDTPPPGQDIIACVGLEKLFFSEDMTEAKFRSFQKFTRSIRGERVLWLTRPFQVRCRDPCSAETLGVARTIRTELGLQFVTLEVAPGEPEFAALALKVFDKVCMVDDEGFLNSDKEYVVDNGRICIGRFHAANLKNEVSTHGPGGHSQQDAPVHLDVAQTGKLETLHWRPDNSTRNDATMTLNDHSVEVEIRAVGLNFKDVLLAMGVLSSRSTAPHPDDGSGNVDLGMEASGVIRKAGAHAHDLRPGDRVMLFSPTSALRTRVAIPAACVVRFPDSLSFEEAATVPICFSTSMYSLLEVGRLKRGQSVLIHSACGGVGLAAIQVCQMMGAEIFATVDVKTEAKIQYLINRCGIPRNRIFNSRDTSFADGVLRESHGRGVDIVLNSLAGHMLHASWSCVAEYGTMVELGKRDLDGGGRLDMMPFSANRTYAGVDIHRFICERPAEMVRLLSLFLEMHEKALLGPIEPLSCFEAAAVQQAFRHVQRASRIGKVIVRMPQEHDEPIDVSGCPRDVAFDPGAAYLLVGGSTGLGASIATWLVERGARKLAFLSRGYDANMESDSLYAELRAMGCLVSITRGSVENVEDVQTAVESCEVPIKGVFHLAMVLKDAPILDMTWTQWRAAVDVKVKGAWNLHHALIDEPLDFFWMASSVVSCLELPGQANYSAGCAFLEAFCQFRHSNGLPATVLNICPIRGVGYVAKNPRAMRNMTAQGVYFLGEREFLDFVSLNILDSNQDTRFDDQKKTASFSLANSGSAWRNPNQVVAGLRSASQVDFGYHLDSPHNKTNWRRDRRMGFYHNMRTNKNAEATGNSTNETSALATFLSRIHQEPGLLAESGTVGFLASEIGKEVLGFIIRSESDVDVSKTLAELGLDSLVAHELRRWFRQVFGITMSVLEIMGAGTLMQLGEVIKDRLVESLHHADLED